MNGIDRFEHELPAALGDVAGIGRHDYLDTVLGRTSRTRQRPAWASLERWLPMELTTKRATFARVPWRAVAVLAALMLLTAAILLYAGSRQRRLPPAFGPAANGAIPFSKDGDTWLGDPVTGTSRLVLGGPDVDEGPGFSSDGTLLGVLREGSAGLVTIVVFDPEGKGERTITPEPLRNLGYAEWVPGRHAIVATHEVDGLQRLDVFDADGAPTSTLLEGASVGWAIYRPPLADEMVVNGQIDGTWGLFAMHTDGTNPRLLARSELALTHPGDGLARDLGNPAFSPDGSKLYYNRYVPDTDALQVWVMNADGTGQHRFIAAAPSCCEVAASPSPDGRWVVLWRDPADGVGGEALVLYPPDGSGGGKVLDVPAYLADAGIIWSPDSTKILLIPGDARAAGTGLVDVATGSYAVLPWGGNSDGDWQRVAR